MSVIDKRLNVSNLSKEQQLSLWRALNGNIEFTFLNRVVYFVRREDRWCYGAGGMANPLRFSGNITLEELLEELKNGTAYS